MAANESIVTRKYPFGIAGAGLSEIERRVPAGEPLPLPPNAELRVIGKPVPRLDGVEKVTGAARYTVDIQLSGMLHARMLRSPYPHAHIRSIDLSAAEQDPDVRAIHIITEPVGGAREANSGGSMRRAEDTVPDALYIGAPIVAIAATTQSAADLGLAKIKVDYEVLPFVVDMDHARDPAAPPVFRGPVVGESFAGGTLAGGEVPQQGNVRGPVKTGSRGNVAQGFAEAEIVVEGEFRTQVQTHCCLETHAVVADWRTDGLTVHISTQFTAGVRDELAKAFGLPLSRVRVIVGAMGGGFGSKSSAGNYARAAVALSRKARAPGRLVLDRREEHLDSGNRPGTYQRLRIGALRDGTLKAISLYTYGTAGTGLGAGVGNIAQAMYSCSHFDIEQYDVFINAGPGSPMRGPGNTPGAFALEQVIDELTEQVEIDPVALRDRIDRSPARREERRIGAEIIHWHERRRPGTDRGPVKRGLGMAQSLWGANVHANSACEVRILRDGSVEVLSGVQDIGTGTKTVLAQIVAEELGLEPQDIVLRIGDTDFPAGPPSYGSRTTASMTPAARNAAYRVLKELLRTVAPVLGARAEELVVGRGRIAVRGNADKSLSFRDAASYLATEQITAFASREEDYGGYRWHRGDNAGAKTDLGGVQFAEVAVDTETGTVRVQRVVAVHDCGRLINPLHVKNQIQGGILQGISYALLENRLLDRHSGHMLNADFEHYKIVGPGETPQIDVQLIENYLGCSSTDAYGVAEPANIATAAAIANAVYNAIGCRIRELPMTPAVVLKALGRLPQGI
jgi:xanthine dehydrogenase YagR molybdenum-binding subunit